MQKIVLFIEPNDDLWATPLKIGNLFMNRFAVDEDAASEVLKIFELEKTSDEMSYHKHPKKGPPVDTFYIFPRIFCVFDSSFMEKQYKKTVGS